MKDLGTLGVRAESGTFEGYNTSSDGVLNPSNINKYPDKYGVVKLKAYNLSFDTGKNIDDSPNIAGALTRLGVGSTEPVPITLTARYSRTRIDEASESAGGVHYTVEDANAVSYLTSWSRKRSIIMLFWMPNTESTDWLSYGQDRDFFTSQLRTLYDVMWDQNLGNSETGWHDSTYGTYHYFIEDLFGSGNDYEPCALPVILNKVTVKETADGVGVEVSVNGFVLENEG